MKILFDFFPILIFFCAFKLAGIFTATLIAMIASCLQIGIYFWKYRKCDLLHGITCMTILVLGSATLFLHNALFVKWKPTVVYWLFAIVFFCSHFMGKKTLVAHMLDKQFSLAPMVWQRLNRQWVLFFTLMGALNIYVLYHFSTNAWVDFKLFGTLGLSFLFLLWQALYLHRFEKISVKD